MPKILFSMIETYDEFGHKRWWVGNTGYCTYDDAVRDLINRLKLGVPIS